MILFILSIILTVVGIVLLVLSAKLYDFHHALSGFLCTVIGGLVVFFILLFLMEKESQFAYREDQYNNLKAQVEMCDRDDIVTDANLRNQVLEMNNDICKHRRYSINVWTGMFYSKRIGDLELLQWKSDNDRQ
jgi:hypothetical protein